MVGGILVAQYRRKPLHIYAISLGANSFVVSAIFFGIRYSSLQMLEKLPEGVRKEYTASVASGTVTGAATSIISSKYKSLYCQIEQHNLMCGYLFCRTGMEVYVFIFIRRSCYWHIRYAFNDGKMHVY